MENSKEVKVESVKAINSQNQAVNLTAVPVTGAIQVKFSEAVTKDSVNVNNLRVYEADGHIPVSILASNITLSQDGLTATVDLKNASLKKSKGYKVEVKDVKNAKDVTVQTKSVEFKTSDVAVVTNAYFANNTAQNTNNAPTGVQRIDVAYDVKLSPSSVTTSNVSLVDVATGNKVPLNLAVQGATNNIINITTDVALPDNKQYTLSINNVKTATGEDAETFTKTFAVNAPAPLTGVQTFTTLDGKNILTPTAVWPKLTAGTQEAGNVYHAGLQLNVGNVAKLDTTTIEENVQLVEKVSKAVVATTITYNADAKILTVVPKADLKEATAYELQFKGGLKSTDGIFLDAAKKTEVITDETLPFTTLDVTAPTVVSVASKNGESGLKLNEVQEFTVKLSEPANLTTNNVVLAETGVDFNDKTSITAKRIVASQLSVALVPGTTDTYTVKLKANATGVAQNKAYKLVIVGKDLAQTPLVTTVGNAVNVLTDGAGNTLKSSTTLAFTTEGADVTPPKVSKVYKGTTLTEANEVTTATNVTKSDKFTFLFNEAIKDNTDIDTTKVKVEQYNSATGAWATAAGFTAATDVKNTAVVTNTAGDKVGLTVELTSITTMADAKYRIVIGEGTVQDKAGNKNTQETVFEFIGTNGLDTAASVNVQTGSVTSGAFTASADTDKKIYVSFDEDQIFEVPASSVKVTDKDGNFVEGTLKEIAQPTGLNLPGFADTNKVYEFTPAAKLNAGAVYTVTVEGVKDIVGNTIGKKVVQFTTTAAAVKVAETSVADGAQAVNRKQTITAKLTTARALVADAGATFDVGEVRLTTKADPTTVVTGLSVTSSNNIDHNINFNELTANTEYVLTIKVEGETKTINFTTGVVSTDNVKPTLAAVGTVNNITFAAATGTNPYALANLTDDIGLKFSEAVKLDTTSKVVITEVLENKEVAVLANTVKDTDVSITGTETLTINPVLDLGAGKTYKVVVTGVKDVAGNVADDIMIYVVTPQ